MKHFIIITSLFITSVYAYCEWNGDSGLNVLDVVATVDCIMTGCWDGSQCDWNEDGGLNVLDVVGTVDCIMTNCWDSLVTGCMDLDACNYDPEAIVPDVDSCLYYDCYMDCGGSAILDDCLECVEGDTGHEFNYAMDCNGDCWGFAYENECGCVEGDTGLEPDWCFSGCMDSIAQNYDPEAIVDDGSCFYYDINGNMFTSVVIGEQRWMGENLRVTQYNNGVSLTHEEVGADWMYLNVGAYCSYENEPANSLEYGYLYNWYAVDDPSGVCPEGFHVPSDAEFMDLEVFLGMELEVVQSSGWRGTDEGGKLKETGLAHWADPNNGATDEFGFTALPGGFRNHYGGWFGEITVYVEFWTSSVADPPYEVNFAMKRALNHLRSDIYRERVDKNYGYSIRCLRD